LTNNYKAGLVFPIIFQGITENLIQNIKEVFMD